MKQFENNEIDILLRGLARNEKGAEALENESPAPGSHLDADELSSYAEGVLPLSTHARYTAHLADCDHCRKVVAQLALASAMITRQRFAESPLAEWSWRERLTALFTPRVWRYALPAVALVAVVAVAVSVWRQQRASSFVALNSQREVPSEAQKASAPPDQSPGFYGSAPHKTGDTRNNKQEKAQPNTTSDDAKKLDKAETTPTVAASPAATSSPAAAREQEKDAEVAAARPYAVEPPPKPPASTVAKEQPTKASDEAGAENRPAVERKREINEEERDLAKQKREDTARVSAGAVTQRGSSASKSATPTSAVARKRKGAAGEEGAQRAGNVAGRRAESESESETRNVRGRRFRKENGVWIDTAYNSSQSTINVGRGSEQYRALIADEPEIGRIAQQLSGDVIIVWKGRAYRIH